VKLGLPVMLGLLVLGCSARNPDVLYLPSAAGVVTRMLDLASVAGDRIEFQLSGKRGGNEESAGARLGPER
jgi:hypothetical protein